MRKPLSLALVLVLLIAAALPLAGCQRKVRVKTGDIVLCTAGEIIEDNTTELEVPVDEVTNHSVTTTVITCDQHSDISKLYDEAQKAIEIGDLVTARERLLAVVAVDGSYGNARAQLDDINGGRTPRADSAAGATGGTGGAGGTGGTGGAGGTGGEGEPIGPVANLAKWVPDAIAGYVAQGILADVGSLSRQYIPQAKSADQLMIAVDQTVDSAAAAAEAADIGRYYTRDVATHQVGGRTVTVGVRDQFAAAAFADGAVLIVIELHATGASGSAVIGDALAVAEALIK